MCKRMAKLWNDNVHHNSAYIRYRVCCIALNNFLFFFLSFCRSVVHHIEQRVCAADSVCPMVAFAIKRHIAHTIRRLIKPKKKKIKKRNITKRRNVCGHILPWRLIFRIWLIFLRRLVLNAFMVTIHLIRTLVCTLFIMYQAFHFSFISLWFFFHFFFFFLPKQNATHKTCLSFARQITSWIKCKSCAIVHSIPVSFARSRSSCFGHSDGDCVGMNMQFSTIIDLNKNIFLLAHLRPYFSHI